MAMTATERSRVLRERRACGKVCGEFGDHQGPPLHQGCGVKDCLLVPSFTEE
jgi:hypothetical protein